MTNEADRERLATLEAELALLRHNDSELRRKLYEAEPRLARLDAIEAAWEHFQSDPDGSDSMGRFDAVARLLDGKP